MMSAPVENDGARDADEPRAATVRERWASSYRSLTVAARNARGAQSRQAGKDWEKSASSDLPKVDGPVVATRSKRFAVGCEGHAAYRPLVASSQNGLRVTGSQVPELHRPIA